MEATVQTGKTPRTGRRARKLASSNLPWLAWTPLAIGSSGHGRFVFMGLCAHALAHHEKLMKIGNSTAGIVESPLWSYQLGLRNGWMPTDPRAALGTCASLGVSGSDFDGEFQPWQTGGVGAGTIAPSSTSNFPWPPATISHVGVPGNQLPTYTPTGTIVSLAPPTLTASATASVDVGNGWFDSQDTGGAPTPIAGCTYPDPWNAIDATVPPICS